jgi:hypothetical protein
MQTVPVNPKPFLNNLTGKIVIVKSLNGEWDTKGINFVPLFSFPFISYSPFLLMLLIGCLVCLSGFLASVDSYMNLQVPPFLSISYLTSEQACFFFKNKFYFFMLSYFGL